MIYKYDAVIVGEGIAGLTTGPYKSFRKLQRSRHQQSVCFSVSCGSAQGGLQRVWAKRKRTIGNGTSSTP